MTTSVFDLIRAEKSNLEVGPWKEGKIPPSSFPINRPRSIPTGGAWKWRMCEFDALGFHCRVLIRLNAETDRYHAYMSVDTDRSVKVLCHHELHIGDKGWHCHFASGTIEDVMEGVLRDRDCFVMKEAAPSAAAATMFTVNEDNALTKAAQRYRFEAKGGLV
ncbi:MULTISPECIES: hypothetical protein [Aminobacter]|uniref:hypothetical protein n=1 Tax=Aminobacter TaxID=31988 RepID=UPI000D3EBD8D|nr:MULTISPECIES: hypothetical protein [Aminobacter]AWC25624.1 hypothetical protein CO731_05123 [Aminobacter sp. MSH1]CAI2936273.1 conserved protein of unknown function [Aminobacter niigataensis]